MLRIFTLFYKIDFKKVPSGIELFNSVTSAFKPLSAPCPICRTRGKMTEHDSYPRYLIDYDGGGVEEHNVTVKRVMCSSCGDTHALLADIIVPYKSYSIIFILRVLKEYFYTRAVTAICRKYGMAASTLYAWRDRYLTHAALELGAIVEAALLHTSRWLVNAPDICRTSAPSDFYGRFGFSFLQFKETPYFNST